VIVFFTDQQRWDTAGAHGNPLGLTPNFDRSAREGTWVRRSFTVQPVASSTPSQAISLTVSAILAFHEDDVISCSWISFASSHMSVEQSGAWKER
jgi:hypothetical protein